MHCPILRLQTFPDTKLEPTTRWFTFSHENEEAVKTTKVQVQLQIGIGPIKLRHLWLLWTRMVVLSIQSIRLSTQITNQLETYKRTQRELKKETFN